MPLIFQYAPQFSICPSFRCNIGNYFPLFYLINFQVSGNNDVLHHAKHYQNNIILRRWVLKRKKISSFYNLLRGLKIFDKFINENQGFQIEYVSKYRSSRTIIVSLNAVWDKFEQAQTCPRIMKHMLPAASRK